MRWIAAFVGVAVLSQAQITRQVEGRADSLVQVVIYEDLACSDCAAFRAMLDAHLLPKFGDTVAFVHRDFPLAKHPWAKDAAVAARWFTSRGQDIGLAFRRETLAHLDAITINTLPDHIKTFARSRGLDGEAAIAALSDPRFREPVERDMRDGVARGVIHTPTVFVNGKPFVESFPLEDISTAIQEAIALAKRDGFKP